MPTPDNAHDLISGSDGSRRQFLGRVAGVAGGYRPSGDGGGLSFVGYVADLYRDGDNDVRLYEVERRARSVVLHRVQT